MHVSQVRLLICLIGCKLIPVHVSLWEFTAVKHHAAPVSQQQDEAKVGYQLSEIMSIDRPNLEFCFNTLQVVSWWIESSILPPVERYRPVRSWRKEASPGTNETFWYRLSTSTTSQQTSVWSIWDDLISGNEVNGFLKNNTAALLLADLDRKKIQLLCRTVCDCTFIFSIARDKEVYLRLATGFWYCKLSSRRPHRQQEIQ